MYYPEPILLADPGSVGFRFERATLETAGEVKLSGWYVPGDKGVLLFCHGNAGNISHRLESIQIFHRFEVDVFTFDYRGYGESEGRPTGEGTDRDADAAWRYFVEERQVNPKEIVVFGRSLGGAVAAWLVHRHTPGAFILESTFTSIPDIAGKRAFQNPPG